MKIEVLHGKILRSVAGDVVEVNHLPVGPPSADPRDKVSFMTEFIEPIFAKKGFFFAKTACPATPPSNE